MKQLCWDLPWSSRAFRSLDLSQNGTWQERKWCWHWRLWKMPQPQSWVWKADDPGDLWGYQCEQLREAKERNIYSLTSKNIFCINYSFPFPASFPGAVMLWLHTVCLPFSTLVYLCRNLVTQNENCLLTFFDHSHCETFLKTTELAAIPPPLVHWTVFIGEAHILSIFLYSSLSKREKKHSFLLATFSMIQIHQ